MKKSLIALAALAAVGAASAQSTVTISGAMVLGVGTSTLGSTSSKTEIRRQTGNVAFKGTEDLGGGLRASFEVQTSVGAQGDTSMAASALALGDRGAYLALNGGFGTVLVGNAATSVRASFGAIGDVSRLSVISGISAGASTAPSSGSWLTSAGDASARVIYGDAYAKQIGYETPTMNGFKASVGMVPNRSNDSDQYNDKSTASYGVQYNAGPIAVAFNVVDAPQTTSTAGATSVGYQQSTLQASYDLGMAKVGVVHQAIKLDSGTNPGSGLSLTANIPLGAGSIGLGYGKRSASTSSDTRFGDDVKQVFVGYRYDLSKRTHAQLVYNKINRQASTTTNDLKEVHFLIGHSF